MQVMAHKMGASDGNMWLQQVEVRQAGQAFRLGRYPLHFHMQGDMTGNYVKGSTIHHTYNRAMTVHGTNGTLIQVRGAANVVHQQSSTAAHKYIC